MSLKHDARWGVLGCALAAAACSPASPLPPPPPSPVVATAKAETPHVAQSSPSPVVVPAPPDPCAAIARAHAGSLASTSLRTLAPPRSDPLIPALFGACTKTPRGRWAVAIVEAREDPPATAGCWAIVHVDEGGREARVYPPPLGAYEAWDTAKCKATFSEANLVYGNWSSTIFSAPIFTDLDG